MPVGKGEFGEVFIADFFLKTSEKIIIIKIKIILAIIIIFFI